ncbi:Iron-sulfur cluster-binding protein [Methylomonas albis]|uniref:RnfABCDGE type electron transport complex subunit B n=1 Tax=Methylomonas albis TaxID=1854563 RepID=A0ABR9D596_9GAMM|nr:RnfABCDGE type electron transport complex subunit B [Methylomonas albis]MBD9358279.1 RnfABCDGE type electron transport complex subunit B [Methylomonas albis]CAD6881663.1 Iron-sulfur cluster-binding protein [Methylomonas albis]
MSKQSEASLVDLIDALLPQTQCRQCGHQGCRPYAEAISCGQADIDQCPPGGDQGIQLLADLLKLPAKPLNPAFGAQRPLQVAVIDEATCIGCTKCLPPCPTDAILGASKHMHTVIAALCTGCELCIAPCPVNCISMIPANTEWTKANADQSRQRHQAKNQRQAKVEAEKSERLNRQKQLLAKLNKGKTSV